MQTNPPIDQTTKKERRELQRQERAAVQRKRTQRRKLQQIAGIVLVTALVGAGVWALIRYERSKPPTPEGDILSKNGFHWHPELSISIKGEKQEIAANIGIGAVHKELHTHDATGVVHMEMQGLVTKDETTLGAFFKSWGKQFNANCIFDSCNGPDGTVKMFVNGKENTEFENYLMKDKDKIEIKYE